MTGVQTCALPICFPVTIGKYRIIELMDKDITKKQLELDEVKQKKEFFLKNFGSYFAPLLRNEV